jgi:hypothetical protein
LLVSTADTLEASEAGPNGVNVGFDFSWERAKAPVTLFDCFNVHSFGQVFSPVSTGRLADMQFR